MDGKSLLLTTAFRHTINEPNIEAGFERFCVLSRQRADYRTFCDAVATCLREGLIREPIRLPEGALQCHWHLELTPDGVHAARQLLDRSTPPPSPLPQGEEEQVHRCSPSPCGRGLGGGVEPQRTPPIESRAGRQPDDRPANAQTH